MEYETTIDERNGLIETKLRGIISANDVISIMQKNALIAAEKQCFNWINDFSEASYNISTFEIYDFPKELMKIAELLGSNKYRIKRAIVARANDDNHHFAQLVAANRGQSLRLFNTIDEARDWMANQNRAIG